jgi:hypothetical protein
VKEDENKAQKFSAFWDLVFREGVLAAKSNFNAWQSVGFETRSEKVTLLRPISFKSDRLPIAAFAFLQAKRTYPPGCLRRNE